MRASSSWAPQTPLFPQQVRGARLVERKRSPGSRDQGFFLPLLRFARRCAFAFLAGLPPSAYESTPEQELPRDEFGTDL